MCYILLLATYNAPLGGALVMHYFHKFIDGMTDSVDTNQTFLQEQAYMGLHCSAPARMLDRAFFAWSYKNEGTICLSIKTCYKI